MSEHETATKAGRTEPFDGAKAAKRVLRLAATGALASLSEGGHPFASLVTMATSPEGEPVLLLSDLAVHTKNLKRDPRASLLLVAPGGEGGDPLAGARLTVTGTIAASADREADRRRFLARHEEAAGYADFKDFAFYRMAVGDSHLVAGFGRIVTIGRAALLTDCSDAAGLLAAEAGACSHMNEDHGEALSLYATKLLGAPAGDWKTTGADPEGLDLRAGALRARLDFPRKARTAGELRQMLVEFAREARMG